MMSRIRWHLPAFFATALLLIIGLVVVPSQTAQGATGVTATFSKSSDWGTGYEGKYTITNGGSTSLATWKGEFDLPAGHTLSSLWDGSSSVAGSHVTGENTRDGKIAPRGPASFRLNVSYARTRAAPTRCQAHGAGCGGPRT